MKKALSLLLAFITSMFFTLQAAAVEGNTPATGESGPWLWIILAAVAIILVVVIMITGKKR